MTTFTDEFFKKKSIVIGVEALIHDTAPEDNKGDIHSLRYMTEYTYFLKNTHAANSIDIKVEGSPSEVDTDAIWFEKLPYTTIAALGVLAVTGSELYQRLKLTAKETVVATPGELDARLNVRQRR